MGKEQSGRFRTAAFGGFNKEDVAAYIEKAASEHRTALKELEKTRGERDSLLEEKNTLAEEAEKARGESETLRARLAELEAAEERANSLQAELDAISDAARAYEATKERLAVLEMEAAKRAADMERAALDAAGETLGSVDKVVQSLNASYEDVRSDVETTIAHLRGELERISGSLSVIVGVLEKTDGDLRALNDKAQSGMERVKEAANK